MFHPQRVRVPVFLADQTTLQVLHLGVEGSSRVEEELADFVHPVRVAGGVLQAGEESAARCHRPVQTSGHVGWKRKKRDT